MKEKVTTYKLDEPDISIPLDRERFYEEQTAAFKSGGKPTRAVEVIQVFIFNKNGELLIQKRNNQKQHNPGLLDKSIGGHVQFGDSVDYTVMVETVQELQMPSIVLRSDKDFTKTLAIMKSYLNTIAIVKHIDSKIHFLKKQINKEPITIANKAELFFGTYDGSLKTVDKEAKGILSYTIDELEKEIAEYPDRFTYDLKFFIEYYKPQMQDFLSVISKT